MRQSNNRKSRDVTAFLYERLSRDDNLEGESYSIGNQKKLLTKVAKEMGYTNLVHFCDDGISGVTMNRPAFCEMLQQLQDGKAAAVIRKRPFPPGPQLYRSWPAYRGILPGIDIRLVACRTTSIPLKATTSWHLLKICLMNGTPATSVKSGGSATKSKAVPVNP